MLAVLLIRRYVFVSCAVSCFDKVGHQPAANMPSVPARGYMLDLGPLSPNTKHVKKDSMLATLSKLGERDTQQKAIDELRRVITV